MKFLVKSFEELSKKELYDLLQLRSEVFVVEQDCVYQDIDGKDEKAIHVIGIKEDKIIAYTRLFDSGDYFDTPSIGRVVLKKNERSFGYGHELMKVSIKEIRKRCVAKTITISAQLYLQKFYESHGFVAVGEEYLEDDIPHIKMVLE